MRYQGNMTVGGLKILESRRIADLFLRDLDEAAMRKAIYDENILQTRSQKSAKELYGLISKRLATMGPELWTLIRDGSRDVAAHACLAAAVKHSALLGDFLDLVLRDLYRTFSEKISKAVWEDYVEDCRGRDPEMPEWTPSTINRLRSSVFQTLAEAGYIENTRTLKLQAVYIAKPVVSYLERRGEKYVLRCIQVGPS